MGKKIFWSLFLVIIVVGILLGIGLFTPVHRFYNESEACPFCRDEVIHSQQVYEGKLVRVLYNFRPALEGHILIIPKRHVSLFENLTDDEIVEMKSAIQKMQTAFEKAYDKSDYILVLQNGPNGGQSVPHTHLHMIPKGEENVLIVKAQLWLHFLTQTLGGASLSKEELQEKIGLLQQALDDDLIPFLNEK